jgi:hypothetical protein
LPRLIKRRTNPFTLKKELGFPPSSFAFGLY